MHWNRIIVLLMIVYLVFMLWVGLAPAQNIHTPPHGGIILQPITPNVYGPGVNSDGAGRAFTWEPPHSSRTPSTPDMQPPIPQGVRPNVYGPGIGSDNTGMPVVPRYR